MAPAGGRIAAAFERAPLLVEGLTAAARDGDDADAILRTARAIIASLGERERVAILDAHPRIGAPRATLSPLSRGEQGRDADAATLGELARLNGDYERRFGFRFVVFVNGRPLRDIASVLRERVRRSREEELATGLEEFLAIARDRLVRIEC
jgi:2-oxo-4-hydroxy-4-carboxy--5-ureidoimidazoline (OHCU) decarboxylase